MKTLERVYNKNGYEHHLVWRDEDYAITEIKDPETSRVVCYECFKIKFRKEHSIKGKLMPASETCPGNEEWGTHGYSVYNLQQAIDKINLLKLKNNVK
jgi:hypothetical protein